MLTRPEVARQLGKSIATVRRLENHVLHPTRGRSGVWLFDEWEVERLRRDPAKVAKFGRSRWFNQRRGVSSERNATGTVGGDTSARQLLASDLGPLLELFDVLVSARGRHLDRLGVEPEMLDAFASFLGLFD